MPEIVVNINDQDYAIVCDPGEENHLKNLSSRIDDKVRDLTKKFGKIGETRLMVMASLLISDETHELHKKIQNDLAKINLLEKTCLLYTSPSPRDATLSRMPSSA